MNMEPLTMSVDQQMHAAAHEARGGDAPALTVAGQLKTLKPWTLAALAGIAACLIALWTWHWQIMFSAALLIALTMGPLCRWWTRHQEACPLDHVLASYWGRADIFLATWRRRGDVASPRTRVVATRRRGYSADASRGGAAAARGYSADASRGDAGDVASPLT